LRALALREPVFLSNHTIVGNPLIWYSLDCPLLASASYLMKSTLPLNFWAAFVNSGLKLLQWPHQGA